MFQCTSIGRTDTRQTTIGRVYPDVQPVFLFMLRLSLYNAPLLPGPHYRREHVVDVWTQDRGTCCNTKACKSTAYIHTNRARNNNNTLVIGRFKYSVCYINLHRTCPRLKLLRADTNWLSLTRKFALWIHIIWIHFFHSFVGLRMASEYACMSKIGPVL